MHRYSSIQCVDVKVVSRLSYSLSTSCCHVATSDRGCAGGEAVSKRKHFAKAAKPLRGRSERHGYVILVSNEPRCCHAATSERRRIRLKADYYYIALRGASIRRSQRGNSEAVFFRGTLPRRYSIKRSQRGNSEATLHTLYATFAATPLSTYLSCVVTARRTAAQNFLKNFISFR